MGEGQNLYIMYIDRLRVMCYFFEFKDLVLWK